MNIESLIEFYDYVGHPILILDSSAKTILAANSALSELSTFNLDDLEAMPTRRLFVDSEARWRAIESIFANSEGGVEIEEPDLKMRRRSGRRISVSIKLRKPSGSLYTVCSVFDRSALIELEQERERVAQKTALSARLSDIARLTAGIAHEINNPLMVIQGNAELLETQVNEAHVASANVEKIRGAVQRMATIIQQIMWVSKTGSSDVERADLRDCISEVIRRMETKFDDYHVDVEYDASRAIPIEINRDQIGQILQNILNNAVHALASREYGRRIIIETYIEQGKPIVRVWNNGPPILSSVADKLMTPFFSTKEVGDGVGLGLYVSQGIMRAHGGELVCETLSRGCAFRMEFA